MPIFVDILSHFIIVFPLEKAIFAQIFGTHLE